MNTSPTGRVEGVRSKAPDRWASHPLRTSLPALRRVSVSAADRSTLVLVLLVPFRRRPAIAAARLALARRRHTAAAASKLKLLGHRLVHRHSRPDGVARVAAAHRYRSASPARRQFCLVRYGAVFNVGVQLCVGLDGDGDEAGSHAMMSG